VVVSQIKKSNTNLAFQDSDILFEDNHLIIVNKPCGLLVQGDKTGDVPLLEVIRKYIKDKYDKKGNVFLGLVNRIDRPTSGIVIFAKTSKALSRMNEKLKNREIKKIYWLIISNKFESKKEYLRVGLKKTTIRTSLFFQLKKMTIQNLDL
jgi:23S rRNA pseudouridine1911/1915/1917 synthase